MSAAQEPPLPPVARMADAEIEALANGIGIAPGEVKRMLLLGPLHDWSSFTRTNELSTHAKTKNDTRG